MFKAFVTHSGYFHADELFSTVVPRKLFGSNIPIIRTRNSDELSEYLNSKNYVVYDVGESYNPSLFNFDHHQKEDVGHHSNSIPKASFGLIWETFGMELCSKLISENDLPPKFITSLYNYIQSYFVYYVDGIDNGVLDIPLCQCSSNKEHLDFKPLTFSSILGAFLPESPHRTNYAFNTVLKIVDIVFTEELTKKIQTYKSSSIIKNLINNRKTPSYIILEHYVPWIEAIFEHDTAAEVQFCIFKTHEDSWAIQQVPLSISSWQGRSSFPDIWSGLSNQSLVEVTGIKDVYFCHKSGFMAKTKTLDSAIKLTEKALEINCATNA